MSKVFAMFCKANDQRKGAGLGLYIVADTLKKLGGNIEVSSELRLGTRFTMTIPIILQEVVVERWSEAQ